MAQFTFYASTDASAPSLTGQVNSMVNVLDACLVNGYGSKSPAGWTKPYTGTNIAWFKPAGPSCYFCIYDDGSIAGAGAREGTLLIHDSVVGGIGQVPTAIPGVMANNYCWYRKSSTADGTARAWMVFADNKTAIMFIKTSETTNWTCGIMFGEFYSTMENDQYRHLIIGRCGTNVAGSTYETLAAYLSIYPNASTTVIPTGYQQGHVMQRNHLGTGGPLGFWKHSDHANSIWTSNTYLPYQRSEGYIPFPNPCDGKIYVSPMWIRDPYTFPQYCMRGRLRGLWGWNHPITAAVPDLYTFSGAGDYSNRQFMLIRCYAGEYGSNQWYARDSILCVETSNTLDTNPVWS